MSTQSPEPWVDNNRPILTQANWNRARDCVNGCAGLNPTALPLVIEKGWALIAALQKADVRVWEAKEVQEFRKVLLHAQEPG